MGVRMRAPLQDLRFLHMAKDLEEMFEGLERAFERHIPPGAVRNALDPIFRDGPFHARLKEAYGQLNAKVAAASADVTPEHLLEAILACERSAQKFYLDNAPRLSDPALAQVFLGLAKEEGMHIRVVEEALRLQRAANP